jgi:hypothetical protein
MDFDGMQLSQTARALLPSYLEFLKLGRLLNPVILTKMGWVLTALNFTKVIGTAAIRGGGQTHGAHQRYSERALILGILK